MTRPSAIRNNADIHTLVDDISAGSALLLALKILERESGSWALFVRLGDDDPPRPDGRRLFGIVRHKDLSEPLDEHHIRDTITSWLAGKN